MRNKIILGLFSSLAIASFPLASHSVDDLASIIRGGKLYDKWYAVIGAEKPKDTHPAWPASNTKKKGDATHRCKSCHGWDLMGKDGAYASGSYQTGIKGVTAMKGVAADKVIAVMKDKTHGYSGKMSDQDFADLANFVSRGQVDMDAMIDRSSKKARGDAGKGKNYYVAVCAGCHGDDGKEPKDMEPLGKLTNKNPWEVVHKVMNGQPNEKMPAMRAFDQQVTVDILAYLQSLPE